MMKRIQLIVWCWVILSSVVYAASVDFDVQPRIAQLGEAVNVTVSVNDVKSPQEPKLSHPDFKFRSAGTSTQVQFINGKKSSTQIFNYRFVPSKTGHFEIGPFSYEVKPGQRVKLPPIQLKVVAPSNTKSNQDADISDFLFATFTSERDVVYAQETVELTLSIYSKGIQLGGQIKLLDFQTDGIKLGEFGDSREEREVVNGELFTVKRFRAKALVTKTGIVTGKPVLSVPVVSRQQRNSRFRDPFFNDMFQSTNMVEVVAKPLQITAKPIPLEGRPADYSGAVGQFKMQVSLTPTEVKTGEPVNVKVDIQGRGNINVVSVPEIQYGDLFKSYEANLVENNVDADGFAGSKTFEQVAIPRSENVTEFPEVRFSYFDTVAGQYQTIVQGPFPLTVQKGSVAQVKSAAPLERSASKSTDDVETGGQDIVYLKAAPAKWEQNGFSMLSRHLIILGYGIPLLLILFLLIWGFRSRYGNSDEVAQRRKQAYKMASKSLKSISVTDVDEYYNRISIAIHGYFADYYHLFPGESIPFERLPESVSDDVRSILAVCEQARFAKSAAAPPTDGWIGNILDVLKTHEKSAKGQV